MNPRHLFASCMVAAAAALALPSAAHAQSIELQFLGRYSSGIYNAGGAEIPAYDAVTRQLFVVNLADRSVDVLSLADPAAPAKVTAIDLSTLGQSANSVSVKNGVLAVAIEAVVKTDPGLVAFYDTTSLTLLSTATVGALPDMLTWTPDGRRVVVANEGEPSTDGLVDPAGSVSVIDMADVSAPVVRTLGFGALDQPVYRDALLAAGLRVRPGKTLAADLEPEYVAIAPDGKTAYVTLQENNAIAAISLARPRLLSVRPLGSKDHAIAGEGLDPSDRDGGGLIGNWPVRGLYMPDAIAAYRTLGRLFVVTANEGDQREYDDYTDSARVKDLLLDATAFPDAASLQGDAQLGRLTVSTQDGDTDNDGDIDRLYSFGARSFSIWNSDGTRVFDSRDDFERITLAQLPANFNADHTGNAIDNRSDNKGPEPEGLALHTQDGRTYALIGLERIGGLMVYDITEPATSRFVQYVNTRDFTQEPSSGLAGDLGPEGILVIPASDSPSGEALAVVANEVSGTTAVFAIRNATVPTGRRGRGR